MKIIVVLSGGLDSTTLLNDLFYQGHELKAISFDYNQRHKKELEIAKYNTQRLDIEHRVVDVSFLGDLLNKSSLTGETKVPEGDYRDETMKSTVVPNRNMIMASIAIGWAINEDFDTVALGVHSGDHAIYPDCRPEFVEALNSLSRIVDYKPIDVIAPYLHLTKDQIVQIGLVVGVDYANTWTCYNGRDKACGKCGSCVERLEAFANNNAIDPLEYE